MERSHSNNTYWNIKKERVKNQLHSKHILIIILTLIFLLRPAKFSTCSSSTATSAQIATQLDITFLFLNVNFLVKINFIIDHKL